MTKLNKKPLFIPGLGERKKDYKHLNKTFDVMKIDWNNIRLPKQRYETVVAFSLGTLLAIEYAAKHKVKKLILCSMPAFIFDERKLKADKIIYMKGEKETNVQPADIEVKGAGHKINKAYLRELLLAVKG